MARPADAVGPSTGSINRFTGMASINVMTLVDGLLKFNGRCRTAQRLFEPTAPVCCRATELKFRVSAHQ
jgi:hypothetical protein